MKRFLATIVLLTVLICTAFAGDVKFLFNDLDQHNELLSGFLPTLLGVGAGYDGLELSEGDLTQIQLTVAGGISSKALYLDPVSGRPLTDGDEDILLFDAWQVRWNLKMLQGFGESWVEGLDLVTVYGGYEGRWERYVDYLLVSGVALPASKLDNPERYIGLFNGFENIPAEVQSIDDWFASYSADRNNSTVYPDLADGDNLFNTFYFGATLNTMLDDNSYVNGAQAELKFQFAPAFLNERASYFSATLNAVAGYTVWQLKQESGLNLVSVTVKDRMNINLTVGDKVPVFASTPVSLGRKVRGFNSNSYGTSFTAVNNLDVRIAGPEAWMEQLFPRVNLFFDMGIGAGDYLNTDYSDGTNFLCSTGFEAECCFWGICDLGIQYSYLISGHNMKTPKSELIFGATFFLDF